MGFTLAARKYPLVIGLVLLVSLPAAPVRGQWPEGWSPFQPVEGLGLERVQAIGAGADDMWIGAADGLYRYDGHSAEKVLDGSVGAILTDRENDVWFAGGGGLWLTQEGGKPEPIFDDVAATSLYQAPDGSLWVGTPTAARRFDPHTQEQVEEVTVDPTARIDPIVRAIAEDGQGRLWLGTGYGVFSYAGLGREPEQSPLQTGEVYTLLLDSRGVLWLGSDKGAYRYREENWEQVIDDRAVWIIFEDEAHSLWLGTSEGLVHYASGVTFTSADGLPSNSVHALAEDRQEGGLWVGTGEGVARLEGRFWRTFDTGAGLPADYVSAIAPDGQDGLWIGTPRGVCLFDGEHCSGPSELATLDVQSLWWDGVDGELWIVAWEQDVTMLFRYDGRSLKQEPQPKDVRAVARDTEGRFWISTPAGLFRYDRTPQPVHPQGIWPEQIRINSIHADCQGYIWFGTNLGLWRCVEGDPPGCDRPPYLEERDVLGIADDGEGNYWLATDEGVYLYVRKVDHTSPAAVFSMADGLPAQTVNTVYRDHRNGLWFGTEAGLSHYQPGRRPPRVFGTEGERLVEGGAQVIRGYDEIRAPLRLKGGDWRANPTRLLYSYVLENEGVAVEQGLGDGPSLVLAKLRYGHLWGDRTYQLRVQALDRDLRTSDEVVLPITVKPRPLTREPWFWPGIAGVLVLAGVPTGVWGYVWWRTRPRKYTDYLLTFSLAEPEQLGITVKTPGQPTGKQEVRLFSDEIERMVWRVKEDQYDDLSLEFLGRRLCGAVFPTSPSEVLKRPARIRLDLAAAPQLVAWPWELILDAAGLGYLGQRADTAVVRFMPAGTEGEKPLVAQSLRVLVVMAQPDDERVSELGLKDEKARLDGILGQMTQIEVDYLLGVHAAALVGSEAARRDLPDQLEERLVDGWDVLHFTGHAGPDLLGLSEGIVLWCEDRRGDYMALTVEDLGVMLNSLASERKAPKLVVLSACRTADMGSELVQVILNTGVGAVVGMQWPVLDMASRAFAEGFYGTLVRHGQVDYAVSVARSRMAGKVGLKRRDWAAPILVTQMADGVIFERV